MSTSKKIKDGRVFPKNIIYFSSFGSLRWGGQKSLYHLVTRLNGHKYRPYVLLPTDEDLAAALRTHGINVIIYPLPTLRAFNPCPVLSALKYLMKRIEEDHISLLHTDGPRNTFYGGLAAKLKNRPLVWHIRSSDHDRHDALLALFCRKIILVAEALRNRFPQSWYDRKYSIIHNGIDLREFDCASPLPIRSECGLDENVLLIGSFARIEAMKGQQQLIEACQALKKLLPFRLLLYGEIHDPLYHRNCLETIEELNLQEHVIFGGHQKNVAGIMKAMDVIVLNSNFGEAFSRSIIEAMGAGKPVIATNVGGSAEAVENGVSGFIVPPGDISQLKEKILTLSTDAALRARFGAAGRKRVEKFFTIENNVRKTELVYEELLDGT